MVKSNLLLVVSFCFFAGLFLIPLFFLPNAIVAYEVPKVKFFLVWSSVLFVFSYIVFLVAFKLKIEIPARFLMALLFLFLLFLLSFFGVDFKRSFFGNFYRWDGLVTLVSLMSFSFSAYILKRVVDIGKLMFYSTTLSVVCVFVWCLLQYMSGVLTVFAGFGQPVFLAGYIFVVSPFLFYGCNKYLGKKWVSYLFFVMLSIIGVLTGTLFGYMAILLYVVALLFLNNKISLRSLVGLAFFIFVAGVGVYGVEQTKTSSLVFEGRERIIRKSVLAFWDRPVAGWGYANYDAAFSGVDWPIKVNDDVYMDKAHSHLLEFLVTTGVVGLFSYLILLFYFFKDLYGSEKSNNRHLLLFLIFYFVHSQTNIVGISEEMVFWLVFGLVE